MKHLHFSGYCHSDHVEIYVYPDKRVEVYCWNDGYPNRMAGGGYSRDVPKHLVQNYNQEKFIQWLQANFWPGGPIDICQPVKEHVVKKFLKNARSEQERVENTPKVTVPEKGSKENRNETFNKDCGQERKESFEQVLHRNDVKDLQRTNDSAPKRANLFAESWNAFLSLWKNWANYSGTAGRKDFWLGSIMHIIAMYVGLIPITILVLFLSATGLISLVVFAAICICAFWVPLISLYVRRANDVGLKKADILLVAVATPVVGALIIGACPPKRKVLYKGLAWCYRCIAIGFGIYCYGGFIGVSSGIMEAVVPIVGVGLGVCMVAEVVGAIIVKGNGPKKYVCDVCGWIYDEAETGVKWENLPEGFACGVCGVGREHFSKM